ncbi:MAG: YdjY domain-containing protein [Phycisphaerae bacterium]
MRLIAFAAALMMAWTCCQAQAPATTPATSSQPAGKVLKLPGLTVDLDKRQIVLDTTVCNRKAFLELLVCRTDTKERESILSTKAKGANLHAALLALGLAQGIPAQWSGDDENGKFLPPRGAELKLTLRWKDKDGKAREADPSEWIVTADKRKAVPPKKWVFVGSDIAPNGMYIADHPDLGHIISVSNFPDSVIDVPFESTSSDEALEFAANTDKIPDKGTPVEVVITPLEGADKSPYARATLEIDRLGQLKIDGQAVSADKLSDWAGHFSDIHNKAQVVIRADGRALVYDVEAAKQAMRLGGIRSFREQFLTPDATVLPRTAAQVKEALSVWAEKFAHPRDYIMDPGEDADGVLKDIAQYIAEQDAGKELLKDYAAKLRKAAADYRASTQPAGKPAPGRAGGGD